MVIGQVVRVVKTLHQSDISICAISNLGQRLTYISVVVVRTTGVEVYTTGGAGTELVVPTS